MKTPQRLMAILAAAFILFGSFPAFAADDGIDFPIPDEAPPFHAHVELRMGYAVIGTFTDFTPDITRIETLYSLDGENWQTGTENWNLYGLDSNDESKLENLKSQPCLLSVHEPLKSYIAGEIDRFYLKLRITRKSGLSYETQSAVIERSGFMPVPEDAQCRAWFSSDIAVRESFPDSPYYYRQYGRYQITVPADVSAQEISALLPDTLPIEIQLDRGPDFLAIGVVDCPVTWKPLSLPLLTAGESITIPDAAEEILVPGGTQVSTPLGIFQLEESLSLDTLPSTDEVRLVLNVSPQDSNPTGVLKEDRDGLKISLRQKATGATAVQAYVLSEGESEWTELSGLSLLKELNAQLSTENSGYGLLLRKDQEPYRSYLAAVAAGETPATFFVGLRFQGGLYDGKELILSWPDTYEELPDLPKIKGAGGNEGNAGADNKEDSTESGQRPNLPQVPEPSSAISENQNASSTDKSISEPNQLFSGQRLSLPQTATEDADSSAESQVDSPAFAPPTVEALSDTYLFDKKVAIVHTREKGSHIPFIPMALITVIAIGGCMAGIAFYRTKGYCMLKKKRIVRK